MKYFEVMQSLQASGNLHKYAPYILLFEGGSLLAMLYNSLVEIPIICKLHYDTEWESSYNRQFDASSMKASLYPMMLRWLTREANILT